VFQIGLTGGICSGKSYVLEIFKQLGCYTFHADNLAKEIIFNPKSEILDGIVVLCGKVVLDANGSLNRERFSEILFADADIREAVNQLVHPLVFRERNRKIEEVRETGIYDFFVYESALLVEADSYREFDKIVVVYTSLEEQIKRLMARDRLDRQAAENKIQLQFPLKEKLRIADYIVDTSGSFDHTRVATLEVFHLMKKDLGVSEK